MVKRPHSLLVGGMVAVLAVGAAAQPATRFMLASAMDMDGQPLIGLTADDFIVYEDGRPVETVNVTPAAYPVALLVDTTQSARAEFMLLRTAARQFLSRLSGREVALYTFGERASRVADFTRDLPRLERAVDSLFARPEAESHVLDALIEASGDIRRRESPVTLVVVLSAGGNDQSNRTPSEVFRAVLSARSIVQVVEMRSPRASGRLINPRGRRSSTSDRAAEAALGLEELLRALGERTQGGYSLIYSGSGYAATLDRINRTLASEVVVEYVPAAAGSSNAPLKIGTHVVGAVVRGVGLDRAPRDR